MQYAERLLAPKKTFVLFRLYSRPLRRTTILLHFAWITNALTYYGLVMLTTEVHAEKKEECGDDKKPMIDNKDYLDIVIVTMAESVGLLLAFISVDRLGRLRYNSSLDICSPTVYWTISMQSVYALHLLNRVVCGMSDALEIDARWL